MSPWNRRSIRLRGSDYCANGVYFITICIHDKQKVFGRIENRAVILNNFGKIAQNEWIKTEHIRANVTLDAFIIMPDHMHGILIIENKRNNFREIVNGGDTKCSVPRTIIPESLGSIIGQYKSVINL